MKQCRSCAQFIDEQLNVCPSCGYNFQTDTIDPPFRQKPQDKKSPTGKKTVPSGRRGVDHKVKMFAFAGLAIVVLSLGVGRFNLDVQSLMSGINGALSKLQKEGIPQNFLHTSEPKNTKNESGRAGLLPLSEFKADANLEKYKGAVVVEGILFDAGGKSFVTLNGKILSEGENYRGAIIKKINQDSVELVIDGETRVLKINQKLSLPTDD